MHYICKYKYVYLWFRMIIFIWTSLVIFCFDFLKQTISNHTGIQWRKQVFDPLLIMNRCQPKKNKNDSLSKKSRNKL